METGKFTPKSRRSCLLRACLLPSVHFSAAITRQALPPDASSMFLTPSSRLLMFIEDSGYGILFPTHTHTPENGLRQCYVLISQRSQEPQGLVLPGGLQAGPGPDGIDRALQGGHFSALPPLHRGSTEGRSL